MSADHDLLMAGVKRIDNLDIDVQEGEERGEYRFERITRAVCAAALAWACAGGFGGGPLSTTVAGDEAGGFRVEHERFVRHGAPETLTLHLDGMKVRDGEVGVTVNANFLRDVELKTVLPQPARVEVSDDGHTFVFRVTKHGSPAPVIFHYEPRGYGPLEAVFRAGDDRTVSFEQFMYP